ncbi:hypothetical protein QR680_003699 [Steinernema hermaphroditum]|uniref:7TM GPCR serpentine receptor class x (Srx) domain-containing protein n=1 Tax=Steinernema hermaphroditum TaxID=289476 RepID=A0AA39LS00_9BILA|nr:hypothetical protein QR680_003699 [Steinernema hermaphroditum]
MAGFLHIFVGLAYVLLALVMFSLNSLFLVTLMLSKEYRTSTYQVIKCLTTACMMQSFVFGIGGVMTMAQSVFNYYLDKALGALIQSAWLLYVGVALTLAVDRLLIFLCPRSADYRFVTTILLSITWLLWILLFVLLNLPGFGCTYGKNDIFLLWLYTDENGSSVLIAVQPFVDLGAFIMEFVIYLIIFAYLVKMKFSNSTQLGSLKSEIKILLSAMFAFILEALSVIMAFWGPINDPKQNIAWDVALNAGWILECGLFVLLTLIVNGTLRRKVLDVIQRKKQSTVSSLSMNVVK